MKGYKAFNSDWTCRDFKYEVGKTYEHEGEIVLCESGFHFCQSLSGVIYYYPLRPTTHFCEVEALGYIISGYDKHVTNKIKIVKEISFDDVLIELSEDKSWKARCAVAVNNYTPIDILIKLSEDKDCSVRCMVARNSNTPADVLIELSEYEDLDIRCAVARNSNAPADILIKLSFDECWSVRRAVAENANTPTNILIKLSEDEDWCVKLAASRNNNTPVDALAKLKEEFYYEQN